MRSRPRSLAGRLFLYFTLASLLWALGLTSLGMVRRSDMGRLEQAQAQAAAEELLRRDEERPLAPQDLEEVCQRYQVGPGSQGLEVRLRQGPVRLQPLRHSGLFLLQEQKVSMFVMAVSWLGIVLLAWVLTVLYAGDLLGRLRQGAAQFGSSSHPLDASRREEISEAVEAFELLAQRLSERQGELRRHIAELERDNAFRAGLLLRVSQELAPELDELGRIASETAEIKGLEVLQRNARSMRAILSDLRDASQLESNQLTLSLERVDLSLPAQSALERVRLLAEPAGLVFRMERPQGPLWVRGDTLRLEQVVVNLLSNAIKFSPPGSTITLSLTLHQGQAQLSVRDEGPGMAPEIVAHLGQEFHQGEGEQGRRGSGLGLAISLRLVELHGGSMAVEGLNPGTLVRVILPLCAQDDLSLPLGDGGTRAS